MKKYVFAVLAVVTLTFGGTARADSAAEILKQSGVEGGLVVHVGCSDGKLTAALRRDDRFLVHGLDVDEKSIAQARGHINSLNLGGKVSVQLFDGKSLPYADNLVNLLVCDDLGGIDMKEATRVLAPGGVVCIERDGKWQKTVKPWPDEIDEWTHYLHDAGNNAVGNDAVVGPPRRYQWLCGPRWARSHDHLATVSAMVSTAGRIFYIIDEAPNASVAFKPCWTLIARDAFSGVLLWKRPIESWEGHLRGFRSGPVNLARRLVAVGERVFVTLGYGEPLSILDAASGETVKVCRKTENALEIIHHENRLFVVVGDRLPPNTDGAGVPVGPDHIWHWWPIHEETLPKKHIVALDSLTGKFLWKKDNADTAEMMPTTLASVGDQTFFHSGRHIIALDSNCGKEKWRAERPVNRNRPSWSAPTLVVHGDTVLCGDRAVDAPPGDVEKSERRSQWVVNSRGGIAPKGQITAFSAADGKKLWESPCREIYNAPVDVFVADGLVWSGDMVNRNDPGVTVARDLKTGEIKRTRPKDQESFKIIMFHHRCYRNKATEKYLVLGRDGIETIDLKTGQATNDPWVRGACQYGVMPCNGLIYAPSHSCACHVESLIGNFNALAPAGEPPRPTPDADRLKRGPAYGETGGRQASAGEGDWPTLRQDPSRWGRSSSTLSAKLKPAWESEIPGGRISSPVIADGKLFVASIDSHAVHALDAKDGKQLWSYSAGGRVDSPPTYYRGTVIFGSADGWIYCLDADDGRLAWRYQAARAERLIVSYNQVESAWPVHGSVLVLDGVVQAVAGRSAHLDGGMVLCRLDATTGKQLSRTPITKASKSDVLAAADGSVFLRHKRFDTEGVEQEPTVPHLYSPAGFLEGSWWHRTYWQFGTRMGSNWGGWPGMGNRVPSGRLLVKDDSTVYGFGRFNQYHRNGAHVGLGQMRYLLYATELNDPEEEKKTSKQTRRGAKKAPTVPAIWQRSLPLLTRGMVLSDPTLFIAGPPDVFPCAKEEVHPYHVVSREALAEQEQSLAGRRGGLLMAVSTTSGEELAKYELDAPPVFDGMAAAEEKLFISTTDGKVVCFRGE